MKSNRKVSGEVENSSEGFVEPLALSEEHLKNCPPQEVQKYKQTGKAPKSFGDVAASIYDTIVDAVKDHKYDTGRLRLEEVMEQPTKHTDIKPEHINHYPMNQMLDPTHEKPTCTCGADVIVPRTSEYYHSRITIPSCVTCGKTMQFFEDFVEGNCKTCHRKSKVEERLLQLSKVSLETRVANLERFLLESENNFYNSFFKV